MDIRQRGKQAGDGMGNGDAFHTTPPVRQAAMTDASCVLVRLRTETRPHHDAIEAALDLTRETLTLDAYLRTLKRFYGFYRPLEDGLADIAGWTERGIDLAQRQKAPLLESDLRALGVASPSALPVCTDLPAHGTVAAALGCLYVLEGATLGGQVISRSVQKATDITIDSGGRFFRGYGDRTGGMWQAFRAALVAFAVTPGDQNEIVSAAKDTFSKLHRWTTAAGDIR